MRYLCTLGLASLLSIAQVQAANKVPGKVQQHHSSSSSEKEVAFDAAYAIIQGGQPLAPAFNPIVFPTEQTGSPVKITHPLSGDASKFAIMKAGTYKISWTLSVQDIGLTATTVAVQLWNFSTQTPIRPSPFQEQTISATGLVEAIFGQTIAYLPAGTILQLRAASAPAVATVINPTFTISRIAD